MSHCQFDSKYDDGEVCNTVGCSSLTIKLIIDDKAFQSSSVQNVIIGRGKVEIGDNAFSYCEDLISVEINGTLLNIGDYAFYGCPEELTINYNGANYNKESIEDVE